MRIKVICTYKNVEIKFDGVRQEFGNLLDQFYY